MYNYIRGEEHEQGVYHTVALPLHILKDVVDEIKVSIYPSVPSSIHGWHHYNPCG
jgi:hypothetical protein